VFFFSSRRRHTSSKRDWSSDVCSSDLMRLRQAINAREKELSRARSRAQRQALHNAVSELRKGDVVRLPRGRRQGHAVVLSRPDFDADGPTLTVLTSDARVRRLSHADIPVDTQVLTRIRVGKHFNSRRPRDRVDLASSMRSALGALVHDDFPTRKKQAPGDETLERLREQLRAHPCHGCAEREDHVRWANRWLKVDKEYQGIIRRIEGRTSSIAREF